MKRKRVAVAGAVVAVVGLAVALFLWFCDRDEGPEPLLLYGNVDIRQVELAFRVPGRIAELRFDEGDRVTEGAVLARLDPRVYEDAIRAAVAEVATHEANLDKLLAGTRPEEISAARAVANERSAALEGARRAYERREALLREEAVSRDAYDQAEATLEQSKARLAAARKELEVAVDGPRKEDIAAARARLEATRASLASAETALADAVLLAPSDGVVLSRVREKGAIVSPADPVFVLSLVEPVWVRAYVSEPQLGRIRPGLEVEVLSDSAPGRPYRGRVGFISPVAEFTPKSVETTDLRTDLVYRLRVVVDDTDEGLRQGMPVTVRVPLEEPPG